MAAAESNQTDWFEPFDSRSELPDPAAFPTASTVTATREINSYSTWLSPARGRRVEVPRCHFDSTWRHPQSRPRTSCLWTRQQRVRAPFETCCAAKIRIFSHSWASFLRSAGFLCPFEANTYGIDFLSFQIEDAGGTGAKLFEISKDPNAPPPQLRVCGIAGLISLSRRSLSFI